MQNALVCDTKAINTALARAQRQARTFGARQAAFVKLCLSTSDPDKYAFPFVTHAFFNPGKSRSSSQHLSVMLKAISARFLGASLFFAGNSVWHGYAQISQFPGFAFAIIPGSEFFREGLRYTTGPFGAPANPSHLFSANSGFGAERMPAISSPFIICSLAFIRRTLHQSPELSSGILAARDSFFAVDDRWINRLVTQQSNGIALNQNLALDEILCALLRWLAQSPEGKRVFWRMTGKKIHQELSYVSSLSFDAAGRCFIARN
ncbi:MAG: hypothetical protein WC901_01975 [Candidatus Margulisiibacteriota bacterium]